MKTRRRGVKRAREGFTLIETIVAMTMFAVVMLGMARMASAVAVRGRTNDLTAKRNAALQLEANKFGAIPFAKLSTWPALDTATVTRNGFKYARRLTLTPSGATRYTIKILVTPSVDPKKKDSIIIERTRPASGSPLCVGC